MPVAAITGIPLIAAFSPVAGLLMDIKLSRHKAVLCSSYAILMKITAVSVAFALFAYFNPYYNTTIAISVYSGVTVLVAIFIINAFQFGMDQLHGSPTEDSILFIH